MGFGTHMIAGSPACSIPARPTHPTITNRSSPHYAEAVSAWYSVVLSCVGFGWYEGRAMGLRKGEWVQSQVGEEVLMEVVEGC
jgi:hypothetical protein